MKQMTEFEKAMQLLEKGDKGFHKLAYAMVLYNNKLLMRNFWNRCYVVIAKNIDGKIVTYEPTGELECVRAHDMVWKIKKHFKL